MTSTPDQSLRERVARAHARLPENDLVAWTSGNVSGRVLGSNRMLIKPSGVMFEDLTADTLCDVDTGTLENFSDYRVSSDTATHAYIYEHMPHVGGIVHTHSRYATAFATHGRSIPCILTAMADEFGGPIPCGGFAMIGGEEIGKVVVEQLTGHRSPAVLLQNHGVFTIGETPEAAVKAAVMCEDVARTVFLAEQMGTPRPLSDAQIDALYNRYQNDYGQKGRS